MISDHVKKYLPAQDYNCAETLLHAANDELNLGLTAEDIRMFAGFGGGCGCGELCGAVASALAVLSKLSVTDRAHRTEGFRDLCAKLMHEMEAEFGSVQCTPIKDKYRDPVVGCQNVVERAADVLEKLLKEQGIL